MGFRPAAGSGRLWRPTDTTACARYGYQAVEAETRARVLYYMQIGYDLAQLNESLETRLSLVPHYLYVFTGVEPRAAEIEEFSAYAKRCWEGEKSHDPT